MGPPVCLMSVVTSIFVPSQSCSSTWYGGDVLHQQRGLQVRPVVEEQIAPAVDARVARQVEVAEGVALGVRDVAPRARVRADARGLEDRRRSSDRSTSWSAAPWSCTRPTHSSRRRRASAAARKLAARMIAMVPARLEPHASRSAPGRARTCRSRSARASASTAMARSRVAEGTQRVARRGAHAGVGVVLGGGGDGVDGCRSRPGRRGPRRRDGARRRSRRWSARRGLETPENELMRAGGRERGEPTLGSESPRRRGRGRRRRRRSGARARSRPRRARRRRCRSSGPWRTRRCPASRRTRRGRRRRTARRTGSVFVCERLDRLLVDLALAEHAEDATAQPPGGDLAGLGVGVVEERRDERRCSRGTRPSRRARASPRPASARRSARRS